VGDYRVQVKRHVGPADIAEVTDLLGAAYAVDGHRPLGEHKWLDLVHGGRLGFAGLLAHEVDDAELVGYGQLTGGDGSWGLEIVVHAAHRGFSEHIGRALLVAALEEVGHQGGGHVHYWIARPTPEQDADAQSLGFRPERELLQLRVRLPLDTEGSGPGPEVRPFVPGADEEAWLAVNNRAFAGHHEQGNWTLATLLEREEEPWFDPEGFLVLWEGDRLCGSCWTKVHTDADPAMGEIFVISVDPEFHHRGLGRALTLAGLDWLARRGLAVGMLYVDESNDSAVRLYRSLGFGVDHRDRAYLVDVAPTNT
jgi:mycothiol synthase